jgi:hypothetical protein
MKRVECVDVKDFRFPSMIGTDFFANDSASGKFNNKYTYCKDGVCKPVTWSSNAMTVGGKTGNVITGRGMVGAGESGHKARHFDMSRLNTNNSAKANYLQKLDDLYILCADIAAANERCNVIIGNIQRENAETKSLSKALKQSTTAGGSKADYVAFNKAKMQLDKDIAALHRDRGNVKSRLRKLPKNQDYMNLEVNTARYNMVLNKIESRLKLLETVEESQARVNDSMRTIMSKTGRDTATKRSYSRDITNGTKVRQGDRTRDRSMSNHDNTQISESRGVTTLTQVEDSTKKSARVRTRSDVPTKEQFQQDTLRNVQSMNETVRKYRFEKKEREVQPTEQKQPEVNRYQYNRLPDATNAKKRMQTLESTQMPTNTALPTDSMINNIAVTPVTEAVSAEPKEQGERKIRIRERQDGQQRTVRSDVEQKRNESRYQPKDERQPQAEQQAERLVRRSDRQPVQRAVTLPFQYDASELEKMLG